MVARKRSGRKAQQAQQPSVEAAATEAAASHVPAQGLQPSLEEVLAAVASLHADQLKPSGRILRKRLAERASGLSMEEIYSSGSNAGLPLLPEIDVTHLRALCDGCAELRIEADEGGDWSAVLLGRPADFVDVHSVEDSYPKELWAAAEEYFLSLEGPEMKLPGGRYACAQALLGRKLVFLAGRSLGQACHIVQLAISERKILGYCNGTVVPYGHSQSMLKERCAEQQQPIVAPAGAAAQAGEAAAPAMPLATWALARQLLREILEEALQPGQGPPVVPLSNVKRLFRSRYHTELSETMLGHSRMADLMQDERFQDLCTLRLQKGGYVVVGNNISPSGKVSPNSKTISLAETLQPQPRSSDAVISLASGLRLGEQEVGKAAAAKSTGAAAPAPSRGKQSLQLASGLQLDVGEPAVASPEPGHAQPLRLELCLGKPMRWGDIEDEPPSLETSPALPLALPLESAPLPLATPLPSPGVAADDAVARWMREPKRLSFCTDEPLRFEDASPLALESGAARQSLPTPLPSPGEPASATVRRWATAPRRAEFFPAPASATAAAAAGGLQLPLSAREEASSASSADPSPLGRERTPKPSGLGSLGKWCPDEPLALEEAGSALLAMPTPLASPGDPGSATRRRWDCVPGGAPRRLEFFPEQEVAAPQLGSPCLLGRTSPERKPQGSLKLGMETSPGLSDGVRLLETLPSPQRKTQALRAGALGRGWLPLARELCAGEVHGCPSSFVQNTFIHAKLPPPTPLGAAVRSQSLPRDLGSRRDDSSSPASLLSGGRSDGTRESTRSSPAQRGAAPLALELPIEQRRSGQPRQPGRFCMEEPLCLGDAGAALEIAEPLHGSSALEDMPRWLAPSPRDSSLALVVRNTFLHSAPSPLTPAACAARRSRSLPPGGAHRGGSPELFRRTFKAPQASDGEEARGRGGGKASVAEASPEFIPISPALAATPAEPSGWLAPRLAPCTAQRVVRLADHI